MREYLAFQVRKHDLRGKFNCESLKTSRFFSQRFWRIVKWGTQEGHQREKKYGDSGPDLQLQDDTFFIIESAKFVLFGSFFFSFLPHGRLSFWNRREKRGNRCTRMRTINKIKLFDRRPERKRFDAKKSQGIIFFAIT